MGRDVHEGNARRGPDEDSGSSKFDFAYYLLSL